MFPDGTARWELGALGGETRDVGRQHGRFCGGRPSRRPVLTFWLIAVALEVLLGVAFLVSGAESAINAGLAKAGIDFGSDRVTAGRVVVVYPAALLGVMLALAQVAAPDLAVLVVARIRDGADLLRAVGRRLRPWSREVGARKGPRIWLAVIVVFSACNLASGLLHKVLLPNDLVWQFSWSMLALLPVAMFLGAFAVKIVAISVVMTFFWAGAGRATLLAIAMHGLSNDVARVGGLVDGDT